MTAAFGGNDIYLSKKPFVILSGHKANQTLDIGNLRANVTWEFVQESCEGCYGGIVSAIAYEMYANIADCRTLPQTDRS